MTPTPTDVILSYGMGGDSTAIALRWALEPETRPAWDTFTVLTAMIRDEKEGRKALAAASQMEA